MNLVAGFQTGNSRGERRLVRFAVVWWFAGSTPYRSPGTDSSRTGRIVADLFNRATVTFGVDTTGMPAGPPTLLADLRAAGWARYLQGRVAFPLLPTILTRDSHYPWMGQKWTSAGTIHGSSKSRQAKTKFSGVRIPFPNSS